MKIHVCHLIASCMTNHGPSGGILAQIGAHDRERFTSSVWSLYPAPGPLDPRAAIADLGAAQHCFGMSAFFDFSVLYPLVRRLRQARPDILHCHLVRANLYGRVAAAMAGAPVALSTLRGVEDYMVGDDRTSRAVRALERRTAPLADRYVAVSEGVRRAAIERLRIAPESIVTIRNAANLEPFLNAADEREAIRREFGLAADAVVIGSAGALIDRKNFPALIRMAARLRAACPNVEIAIVGDGQRRPELEAMVRELGVGGFVRMPGFRADMHRVLGAFDIFALLSLQEGLPRAVMEAMAAGLPCVVTDAGGNAEAVEHGETGYVFPAGRMEECAAALARLAADAELRRRLGQRGRTRAREHFGAAAMTRKYEELYEALLAAAKNEWRRAA